MTSLFLLMVMGDGKVDADFAKYKAVMRTMPLLEVQLSATDKRRLKIDADFVMEGRKRILFDGMTPSGRYTVTITPKKFREVDWATKAYDIYDWHGLVTPFESRISVLPASIPLWLSAGDLGAILPKMSNPKLVGNQTINGETCDLIRGNIKNDRGTAVIEVDVAPSGLVYRYYWQTDGMGGRKQFEWVLRNYKSLKMISDSRFENRIPDGFMPFALPDRHLPVAVGKKPDLSGWVFGRTGQPWTPPRKQPLLFIVTSEDSLPGKNALAAVRGWRAQLNSKHIAVAEASDASSADAAGGLLYNPNRKSVQALDLPGTPMLLLVDSAGTLRNLWMGFSPAESGKIHDELLKAVANLK